MTRLVWIGCLMLAVGAAFGTPTVGRALVVERGTACADHIYVGSVNHGGITDIWMCVQVISGGCSNPTPWRVDSGLTTSSIGDGSGNLEDDIAVYGDNNNSGTGNDIIEVIYTPTTVAAGNTCAGSWTSLTNGHCLDYYLDVYGDGGDDVIYGSKCDDGLTLGQNGNDVLVHHISDLAGGGYFPYASGGSGYDDVLGGLTFGEALQGNDDPDCVGDLNNWSTYWDCGLPDNPGGDNYENEFPGPGSGRAGCENSVADGACG